MKSVYQILRTKYPEQECVLVKEVADSTARRRYLDWMVINLWESRGLSLTGIEVKSYRGDWLKELKSPSKQELHAPYCDYFYLLTTSENVAKLEEIPDNWGWMVVKNEKIFTMKKAPKLEAKPMPKSFMVSIIRRAADKTDFVHKDTINDVIEERATQRAESLRRTLEYDKMNYENLKQKIKEFEQYSGLDLLGASWRYGSMKLLGERVKLVQEFDSNVLISSLERIKEISEKINQTTIKGLLEIKNYEQAKVPDSDSGCQ